MVALSSIWASETTGGASEGKPGGCARTPRATSRVTSVPTWGARLGENRGETGGEMSVRCWGELGGTRRGTRLLLVPGIGIDFPLLASQGIRAWRRETILPVHGATVEERPRMGSPSVAPPVPGQPEGAQQRRVSRPAIYRGRSSSPSLPPRRALLRPASSWPPPRAPATASRRPPGAAPRAIHGQVGG
jgi:hypothetical protein